MSDAETRVGAWPVEQTLALGWRLEHFPTIGSTNDEARKRALQGDRGRLWIVADEQKAGRGRLGRTWVSPPGNLYASALLLDPAPVARGFEIGFVAALALHRAVSDLGGSGFFLKWPNDLIWRGAKVAGLLAEGVTLASGAFACIIGVGVNCAVAPQGAPYPTTSLSAAFGRAVAPAELFGALAPRFAEALAIWRGGEGFAEIRAAWLQVAAGLGAPIRISGADGGREGVFEALDARGRLLLRRAGRLEIVEAGDVRLLGEPAPAAGEAAGKASRR
ncbi:MAG TPA: biotin--[acetyl-CoA-carboxylase] ligase [Roseiarcus sp.]|nr:biotin--[acetyl-CoA-carboxylase] ligase [Roseiarcus sp.]